MLPNPLHPAVVHFPVVLAFLLPIFAAGALWAIRRGARSVRAWSLPLAVAGALLVSSWAAVQTGESQEETIENVVADAPLDAHEEAAESFIWASAIVLLVIGGGLAPGVFGKTMRVLGTAGAVGLVAGAALVGHTGGELVYRHGAASAYATSAQGQLSQSSAGDVRSGRDDDDR